MHICRLMHRMMHGYILSYVLSKQPVSVLYLQQSLLVPLFTTYILYTVNDCFDWFYYFKYFVVECFIRVFYSIAYHFYLRDSGTIDYLDYVPGIGNGITCANGLLPPNNPCWNAPSSYRPFWKALNFWRCEEDPKVFRIKRPLMACSHCLMFIQTPTEARGVSLANSRTYRAFTI